MKLFKNPFVIILLLFLIGSSAYTGITSGMKSMFELIGLFVIGCTIMLVLGFIRSRKMKQ